MGIKKYKPTTPGRRSRKTKDYEPGQTILISQGVKH